MVSIWTIDIWEINVEFCKMNIASHILLVESLVEGIIHWPPGKFEWNFRYVIFKQILVIDG